MDGAVASAWVGKARFLGPDPHGVNASIHLEEDEHTLPVAPPVGWIPSGLDLSFWSILDGSAQGATIYELSTWGNGTGHVNPNPVEVHFDP